jgi:hypothetical protein
MKKMWNKQKPASPSLRPRERKEKMPSAFVDKSAFPLLFPSHLAAAANNGDIAQTNDPGSGKSV